MNMFQSVDYDRASPVAPKPRRMSTGGNRSWSEEEEAYLIQTRMQKMPYKHIAAHLKKTELACRLHYHQLSHGSHRRRRSSTSTTCSNSSNSSVRSISQYPLSGFDNKGFQTQAFGSTNGFHTMTSSQTNLPNASPGKAQHKILLPKPPALMPDTSTDRYGGLRLDNSALGVTPNPIDADRLHAIYNTHRSTFWNAIAAEYGNNLTPNQLEDVWKHNPNTARRPMTPADSPNSRAVHNILKPSPFPQYAAYEQPRDYGMHHMLGGIASTDRQQFPMVTTGASVPYNAMPSLPRLDRHSSWSNPVGAPPTAISTLLNEEKLPLPQNDYNIGARYH